MGAGNDLLSRIAALVEADRAEEIEVEHVRCELLGLRGTDIRGAVLDKDGRIYGLSFVEDFELDLVIGEGPAARTVRIELQPFTLVGATTRLGLLTTPLRDRFGIPVRLQFYDESELFEIVSRGARLMGVEAEEAGAREIARRSRGMPLDME